MMGTDMRKGPVNCLAEEMAVINGWPVGEWGGGGGHGSKKKKMTRDQRDCNSENKSKGL